MRRVWAAVLSVWATLAIVAVLAWTHSAPQPVASQSPAIVIVQGKNGKTKLANVVLSHAAPVTTSGSSRVVP